MTSLVNKYFKKSVASEQALFEGIKTEAIQVSGNTYFYLPRSIQIEDLVLGEDILSKFSAAVPIEMYLQDSQGFGGDKEMLFKFGLEIKNTYKLIVSQSRWVKEVGKVHSDKMKISNRPQEGDLIFDPITKFLLEIKFVDHDAEFYQLGKNYLWHLSCETFQFSSEAFETGNAEIDGFADINTFDLLDDQLLSEDGSPLISDPGDYIINNTSDAGQIKYDASNDFFDEAKEINLKVTNPFSGD